MIFYQQMFFVYVSKFGFLFDIQETGLCFFLRFFTLSPVGALAQLVERNNGIVEASGSRPLRSTSAETFSEMTMSSRFSSCNLLDF